MNRDFWEAIPWPVIGLAPMDGVSDAAFRAIVAKYGKPSLTITEFTAAEGIRAGAERLLQDFIYSPEERPVLAQLFGADPSAFFIAAAVAAALGFDGVDINMGCPAKNIAEKGAGAGLILDPERAKEIIRQARAGITAWAEGTELQDLGVPVHISQAVMQRRSQLNITERLNVPVSVKTRLGVKTNTITDWVQHLLEESPCVITIHGRTLNQLYSGEADWEAIAEAATLIHKTPTKVLGNGDIKSIGDAHAHIQRYRVDGVLIGRACFGNPWIFQGHIATEKERRAVALEHARLFNTLFPGGHFLRMRKHLLDYMHGFDGAKELRVRLMRIQTLADVEQILC